MKNYNENINNPRLNKKSPDEEYIINGCIVNLYYADNCETDPSIMSKIERSLIANFIYADDTLAG